MFIVPITPMNFKASIGDSVQNGQAAGVSSGLPFSAVLQDSIHNLEKTRAQADEDAYRLAMGDTDNLAKLMINAGKASVANEMAVQLVSRAVSSYKEIVQMQI